MTTRRKSVASKAPWYPFWAKEFLTDENLALWPIERKGALLQLRAHAWIGEPPCTLPDDDAMLAKLSGLNRRWKKHANDIRRCFEQAEGRLVDPYLMLLYQEMIEKADRRAIAGEKGARARWSKQDLRHDPAMAASNKPLKIESF
jgi:uncharacterized protein YdaU (DUF1376 family)